MKYKIVISPEAVESYKKIPFEERSNFRKFIDTRLTLDPETIDDLSINDIKGVYGVKFELTKGEVVRIFYDVVGPSIEILSIINSGIYPELGFEITKKRISMKYHKLSQIWTVPLSELNNRIEVARSSIKAGEGLLFNHLPL